ncbi:MAG TPA: hypothetical protein PKI94_07035, partial [Candidatus Gastranaerophilaceae bacterium]|nr:hypothetical protein [Candidatus Gastranaerophilaceae bacterium]
MKLRSLLVSLILMMTLAMPCFADPSGKIVYPGGPLIPVGGTISLHKIDAKYISAGLAPIKPIKPILPPVVPPILPPVVPPVVPPVIPPVVPPVDTSVTGNLPSTETIKTEQFIPKQSQLSQPAMAARTNVTLAGAAAQIHHEQNVILVGYKDNLLLDRGVWNST